MIYVVCESSKYRGGKRVRVMRKGDGGSLWRYRNEGERKVVIKIVKREDGVASFQERVKVVLFVS